VNSGVIDNFLSVFTQYIDSGFGLLGPEVNYLARTLVLIDIILAALFWSWAGDEDIIARLIKKTLFVGVFAYLIGNWQTLSRAVFESFAALGLKASGTGLAEADFLRPGRVAQVGLDAGQPILQSISGLMGFVSFFENFIQITVLLFAWAIVLISFFVLAIQLFVSLIEFKLSTLCGFVLIPFGLFGKTAFAAERVLGNVISSGVKVLVLAVIVGIGSTLFSQFTTGFPATPTISDAMGLVLAALSLLGLGIFGPGIANGIVSGGPQLGAGAAVGTGLTAGGVAAAGIGAASLAVGGGGAALAGVARGGASLAGASVGAFQAGASGGTGLSAVAGGASGVARAGIDAAVVSPLRRVASDLGGRFSSGARAGFEATGGSIGSSAAGGSGADAGAASPAEAGGPPAWARRMSRGQTIDRGVSTAAHAVKSGDGGGAGSSVDLSEPRE
jgi:type IV secretion system protein TrbL